MYAVTSLNDEKYQPLADLTWNQNKQQYCNPNTNEGCGSVSDLLGKQAEIQQLCDAIDLQDQIKENNQRIQKKQPIVAPNDIKRYFVTPQESGELCLMSCLLGENRDIFFPKLSENLHLITFAEIAKKYLKDLGYEAFECKTEDEAREFIKTFPIEKKWPCLFSKSDTTGEKNFEEFFIDGETLDLNRFPNLGIVKSNLSFEDSKLDSFIDNIRSAKQKLVWDKHYILIEFINILEPSNELFFDSRRLSNNTYMHFRDRDIFNEYFRDYLLGKKTLLEASEYINKLKQPEQINTEGYTLAKIENDLYYYGLYKLRLQVSES